MALFSYQHSLLLVSLVLVCARFVQALSNGLPEPKRGENLFTRRAALMTTSQAVIGGVAVTPLPAFAAPDCFKDCVKNCKQIAPKDPDYCIATCKDYCEQDDRNDGLSGSVSSTGGEVGILGGSFQQGTVTKGDDKVRAIIVILFRFIL